MSFSYVVRESISGIKRAKVSGTITIFTITFSLFLISIFLFVLDNTNKIVQHIRNRIEIDVFLQNNLDSAQTQLLKENIFKVNGIDSIKYVSKDEAAIIFRQEFGEDIYQVLDFNPLPPSFKVSVKNDYRNSDSVKVITSQLSALSGIDDVIFRKTLLELLDKRTKVFWQASLGMGVFLSLIAIFLVSNTIRLIIYAKRKIIYTMKLVGATENLIRTPFIIEGIFHGFIAGIISSVLLFLIIKFGLPFLGEDINSLISINELFFPLIVIMGCLLGFLGSIISVRIFIRRAFKY